MNRFGQAQLNRLLRREGRAGIFVNAMTRAVRGGRVLRGPGDDPSPKDE